MVLKHTVRTQIPEVRARARAAACGGILAGSEIDVPRLLCPRPAWCLHNRHNVSSVVRRGPERREIKLRRKCATGQKGLLPSGTPRPSRAH